MTSPNATPVIYLVHPDVRERDRLRALIAGDGFLVRDFASADAFLGVGANGGAGCLVVVLQDEQACELLERLRADGTAIPALVIAEGGNVPAAVRAMRAGASAFLETPYAREVLMREIRRIFVE